MIKKSLKKGNITWRFVAVFGCDGCVLLTSVEVVVVVVVVVVAWGGGVVSIGAISSRPGIEDN